MNKRTLLKSIVGLFIAPKIVPESSPVVKLTPALHGIHPLKPPTGEIYALRYVYTESKEI